MFFAFMFLMDINLKKCVSVVSEDLFMMAYCPNKHKTQRMCNEAFDDCLAALKFIPDWFITSKMLEKSDSALLTNGDIVFFNEDFNKVSFIANQDLLVVDLDKINLDNDTNFDKDVPDAIIPVWLLAWCRKF